MKRRYLTAFTLLAERGIEKERVAMRAILVPILPSANMEKPYTLSMI